MWQLIHDGLREAFLERFTPLEIQKAEKEVLLQAETPMEVAKKLLSKFTN
jgi:hypothetical protein